MDIFKNSIVEVLSERIELDKEKIASLIEIPPNTEMGDYAFPCFQLAKVMRKAPNIIAQELKDSIEPPSTIDKIENAGGYVNFFVNKEKLITSVLDEIISKENKYGSSDEGSGKNVVIDFSAVNIAKPFHIGHLPTTMIGNSLYKIYNFLGYNCIGVNHLGDWGTQFGKLIVAYKKWGNKKEVEENPIRKLVELYVKFHSEAEKDDSLNDEGRAAFKAIEDGEQEYVELWKWFREVSLQEFNRVYGILNVKFDSWNGESFYNDKMESVIDELNRKQLLEESQGAQIVNLERFNMPPCIIKRSDGATLYATRDLAAIFYRKNTYDFDKVLYVVASQQNLHFRQLFKVIELMGYNWSKDLVHVPFGMVSLESGAMSTRKGIVVYLEDVLNESISKVYRIIEERNPALDNKDEVAKKVGIGAIIFGVLYNNRIKDTVFIWDKVLSFEGETAPYIQYTFARICSIFRKVGSEGINKVDYSLLKEDDSLSIIALLSRFPQVIIDAAEKYEPSIIARYIIDLCQSFNKFYHNNPVINDNKELQNARLALCKTTKTVIETGMGLLGIECPERM